MAETPGAQLRRLMSETGCVVAAGSYDALSARMAELAGFPALHISGYALEASQLAAPDIGLMTMSEVVTQASRITSAVGIPAICDVDTGFGGVHSVQRMMREVARAGVAAIQIEDQTLPKRCPLIDHREVLPRSEAVARVEAACDSRADPSFVVIARTDADEISYDESITRANAFLQAGADVAMPLLSKVNGKRFEQMTPDEQVKWCARLVADVDGPVLGLRFPKGCSLSDMAGMGYRIFILPVISLEAAANGMLEALRAARIDGTARRYFEERPSQYPAGRQLMELLGLEDYLSTEVRYETQK